MFKTKEHIMKFPVLKLFWCVALTWPHWDQMHCAKKHDEQNFEEDQNALWQHENCMGRKQMKKWRFCEAHLTQKWCNSVTDPSKLNVSIEHSWCLHWDCDEQNTVPDHTAFHPVCASLSWFRDEVLSVCPHVRKRECTNSASSVRRTRIWHAVLFCKSDSYDSRSQIHMCGFRRRIFFNYYLRMTTGYSTPFSRQCDA